MSELIDFTIPTMYANYRVKAHTYRESTGVRIAATIGYVHNGEYRNQWFFFDSVIEFDAFVDDTLRTLNALK